MELTNRQSTILQSLIKEYIDVASPISSNLLKKRIHFDISPATIRNDLQTLTDQGYITQPHTSAGRVPTNKGYKYFIEITFSQAPPPNFISKEIEHAKENIEKELAVARSLAKSLEEISQTLSYTRLESKDSIFEILKIIGPSRTTYDKNLDAMKKLLEEFENF